MIQLTEKAVNEIKRIWANDASKAGTSPSLRVMVVGGGCSGMSYKLGFNTESPSTQDKAFDQEGVQVIVDSKSYLFLKDMTLDFSDGLNGKGFVFDNPNAKRSCGCGSSFSA